MRMNTSTLRIVGVAIAMAFASGAFAPRAGAQTGNGYNLTWSSVDGGAGSSAAGGYVLRGSIAQPEAGQSSGGAYALRGGFWTSGGGAPTDAPPDLTNGTGALVFRLHPNTPNPFTTATSIGFSLAHEAGVELRIYDLAGRVVRTVLERPLGPGRHQVTWDGRDDAGRLAAHGIYFLRLRAGELEARRKVALVP